MITTPEQYEAHLHLVQNLNAPQYAVLNPDEKVYQIDLKTRSIETPEFLTVQEDHKSEVIYFEVDRFHDYMDLAFTTCLIHYINAEGKAGLYPVPFYDINTKMQAKKMILPWCIDGLATAAAGKIQFSIFFYSMEVEEVKDEKGNTVKKPKYIYRLSTIPAESKILHGMKISALLDADLKDPENMPPTNLPGVTTAVEDLWMEINNRLQQVQQWQSALYWTILD